MPRIIVQADSADSGRSAMTLEEWVQPTQMESDWFSNQLVQRLVWAVQDAADARKYRSLIEPLADAFPRLVVDLLGPIQHIPKHPLLLARFGLSAPLPAASLAPAP